MTRMLLAAAAALALVASQPVLACPDCPHHQGGADQTCKNEGAKGEKEGKCGPDCKCTHCEKKTAEKKDGKKDEKK